MTIAATILGPLTLSSYLVLLGLESAPVAARQVRKTVGGGVHITTLPFSKGRVLSLMSDSHFTLGQITAIQQLARSGQPVTLIHHRGTFTVVIIGVREPTPVIPYSDPDPNDWYSATIDMIEV